MSAIPKPKKFTVAEYLAIEESATTKSEFFDGEMFAMAGASIEHNRVKENLVGELFGRLAGTSCASYSSDQRLKIPATGLYTYPDLLIVCGKVERDPLNRNTITNPTVVFEVLSPGTEGYDRGVKFRHYQKIPSVREVVFVSQDEWVVEVYTRNPEGHRVAGLDFDPAGELYAASVPVEVPLAHVYRGVAELADEAPNTPNDA